jgi:hypothetical protein
MEVLRRAQGHADEKLWSKILNFFGESGFFSRKSCFLLKILLPI